MADRVYIGIDPGKNGAMVALLENNVVDFASPETERDIWQWVEKYGPWIDGEAREEPLHAFAVIEKVSGFIGNAHPGSAMFKFGQDYGGKRMALIAACIPFDEVPPQKWQKALGIAPRKATEKKGQFKNRLKAKAQQLFPWVKVTLANADALLIAEYSRRAYVVLGNDEVVYGRERVE